MNALFLLGLTFGCSTRATTEPTPPTLDPGAPMSDDAHATVEEVLSTVFGAADARRFADARAAMTDTIEVDYSDLGGASGAVEADALVEGWAAFLPHFDRTVQCSVVPFSVSTCTAMPSNVAVARSPA
ncbi:MAG: hypothetical protein AAF211_22460, partial [Myxococcota bacterium]